MQLQVGQNDDVDPVEFDASVLRHQHSIPRQFIWPDEEKPGGAHCPELEVPLIDMSGFLSGESGEEAVRLVGEACRKHGFFVVVNHGVDPKLIAEAHECMNQFFEMPLPQKQMAQRKPGESCGYASSFTARFSSKLPWKETLSFRFSADNSSHLVYRYLSAKLGHQFSHFGYAHCKTPHQFSLLRFNKL